MAMSRSGHHASLTFCVPNPCRSGTELSRHKVSSVANDCTVQCVSLRPSSVYRSLLASYRQVPILSHPATSRIMQLAARQYTLYRVRPGDLKMS
ncbi:hypothetical protein MRB53_038149 [Persea americana]|nr:hypothetical protein MRB53_038149 [Persea americana]